MPDFILNRTHVLDGPGHKIRFEKGQPTWVPPSMVLAAAAIGAECVEGPVDPLGDEETKAPVAPSVEELQARLTKAFDTLVARNERDDFGGNGKPSLDAVKALIGVSITRKECDAAYQTYRQAKADQ